MTRAGIVPRSIGGVLLTPAHGDHVGGVPLLVLDGQFGRRERPLVVGGPPGMAGRLAAAMEVLFPGFSRVAPRFPTELADPAARVPTTVGPVTVTAYRVEHARGAPAYALRVAWAGRVVACSGDTEWCEALVEAPWGADLFVREAYRLERPVRCHLDHATLAAQLPRISARRLILTHLGPEVRAHRDRAVAPCAEDGLVVEV